MNRYDIYTDGSCRNNGNVKASGAWGFVVYHNQERICEYVDTECGQGITNQRAELKGIIAGCRWGLAQTSPDAEIHIHTDSAYAHNCLTQRWYINWQKNGWVNSKKQPVANQDLWKQVIPFFDTERFYFHKVAGHADNQWNNYIDSLVQMASLSNIKGE